ncbi:MAG: peptidoglycan-binding domain-containing protein, partial [Solirubrobacteraceae bacterium]
MAIAATPEQNSVSERGHWRLLAGFLGAAVVVLVAFVLAVLLLSGATLSRDPTALARVSVQLFGGKVRHVSAYSPSGHEIPISVHDGRLTPLVRLTPGEQVSIDVTVRRPGWLGWALGKESVEHLTLSAPVARLSERWLTVTPGSAVQVSFDQPVAKIAYGQEGGLQSHTAGQAQRSFSLGRHGQAGTVLVAAAARSWERLGRPTSVSWFPPSQSAVLVASPAPGSAISPAAPIRLVFSKPVSEVLGSEGPKLSPAVQGRWRKVDSHTLTFTPSGFGLPFDTKLRLTLPRQVAVSQASGGSIPTTSQIEWTVPAGSTLRLQQLLAEQGYLPVEWQSAAEQVAHTPAAEVKAAVVPPKGSFSWRYANTPPQLQALWSPGEANTITRGAIMKFENQHEITVDGLAGPSVWRALLENAIAGKHQAGGEEGGYSYVYVHREVPETATLWHDGHTIISSPANTGISGAETALGSFPVFEHVPETTMSGTNPDGSHYEDPG